MKCFVIMPFRDENHYLYLFLKQQIEDEFDDMICDRADQQAATGLLTDKISAAIVNADVVIADCTGGNANVLYELGMAHAQMKPAILLTRDTPEDAPTDIRGYDFIQYRFDDENALLRQLKMALHSILGRPDDHDYDWIRQVLVEYTASRETTLSTVDKGEFETRVQAKLVPTDSMARKVQIMLPEMIEGRLTIQEALAMEKWINERYPADDQSADTKTWGTNGATAAT
jgi:hypothetical protein